MKKFAFIGLSILLIAVLAGFALSLSAPRETSAADRETFERANQLYQAGSYAEAASLYEQLVAQGIANPDLFYNLGSAYSQSGQPERAAQAYALAAELAPRDPQIAEVVGEGLSTARNVMGVPLPLTANELAIAALLVVCFAALAVVAGRHRVFARREG